MSRFVHLNLHTEYSIVDGLNRIKPLIRTVSELQMPAVAITDRNNLYATIKFYRAAQAAGIKPLIGADLALRRRDKEGGTSRFIALCQDYEGYKNLSHLITKSYLEGQETGQPTIKWEWLSDHADGLIILSGGANGEIGSLLSIGKMEQAGEQCLQWKQLFGDRFYLEIQRIGLEGEEVFIDDTITLAAAHGIPVVATNAVRFLTAEDYEPHEARVCINEGRTLDDPRRPRNYTPQQYLRSPEEMVELFKDVPEAIENTWFIAQRCNVEFNFDDYFLPNFPVPDGYSMEEWFREESRRGLEKRLKILLNPEASDYSERRKIYEDRLEMELEVIIAMGFPGYFLIVADFIHWAKENAIPVGPGRGSGAGSLVAYALEITDLDPLAHDLLFERFLNPERVSMPDFDIDFCMDRRDEVIDYVSRKYGRDHVSQIITHGTMAAKAVVRDCGRVLGLPYGFVDQISKLIPFEIGMTLEKAMKEEPLLQGRYEQEEDVHTLIDLALQLEGTVRNVGKHAGGVVIAPSAMSDFVPLYCEADSSSVVCQFDMIDVETIGLVKFDFLGLRTLTIIDWAIKDANRLLQEKGKEPIDISQIQLDDKVTYELICRAETTAVFQLESRGMKELIKRLKPDVFDDLIALVALFRPGPLQSGMVDDFVERKHGRQEVVYPHPDLEPILKPTYGVILYQEQVMQIAQVLAGYSLGAADLLRRAMGKKKPEEMAKQRQIFIDGARKNGIEEKVSSYIFDLMEKFAGYGFNKSHSAAYALVAYQTAWLKTHHPAAFMAAVLSSDMDNTDKVVGLIDECRHMGLDVMAPDVNSCHSKFTVQDEKTIRYGLGAIKGVGEAAVDCLVEERDKHGPFVNLFDLCRRMDNRRINRRVLEALTKAGAMDGLGPGRSTIMASLDNALKMAEQYSRNRSIGMNDLFGLEPVVDVEESIDAFTAIREWNEEERLANEKATLGLYLSGHPIDRYEKELQHLVSNRLNELKPGPGRIVGQIIAIRMISARRGRMAIATLDDKTGRVEVVVYSDVLEEYGEYLNKDRIVIVDGQCKEDDFNGGYSFTAEQIVDIEKSRAKNAKQLVLRIRRNGREGKLNGLIPELKEILEPYRNGPCRVMIDFQQEKASARICLGTDWRLQLPDRLLDQLTAKLGQDQVIVEY